MTEKEEKIAVRCLREGDEESYLKFYHLYHKRLYSFAFQYLKSRDLAQDAVQEVFIKLWEHRLEINSNVKGFLFTSTRNHVMNMIRNHKTRTLKKIQLEQDTKRVSNKTEDVILYSEYQKILSKALDELSDGKREIFEMKTVHGFSNHEIATKLDITINTVKSQYYHASEFVKDYLERYAGIYAKGS